MSNVDNTIRSWHVTVEYHDDTFSKDAAVICIDRILGCELGVGTLARIAPYHPVKSSRGSVRTASDQHSSSDSRSSDGTISSESESSIGAGRWSTQTASVTSDAFGSDIVVERDKSLVIRIKQLTPDQETKKPHLQVSIHRGVKSALRWSSRQKAVVYAAKAETSKASFVELSFRDQYLSRADMWQLTVSELAGKSIYKGQQLTFMGSIKAKVKNVFVKGRKVNSSLITAATVPIFRSESAKYVFFIQMSREMWEYDVEGSGEVMFNKVINGFLPDLFKRWQRAAVRHLVTIIMFSRIEYEKGILKHDEFEQSTKRNRQFEERQKEYRDYYRVVTTDMVSTGWTRILGDLKKEFKVFLRDILILPGNEAFSKVPDSLADVRDSSNVECVIAGKPTIAAHGNILEAISLASSQFAQDHIDRDLVRTGLSIVIVTPGTGVFEVDYNMLKLTTETLVGNGIGIDLVALSPMPLHSVPLFRYYSAGRSRSGLISQGKTPIGSVGRTAGSSTPRDYLLNSKGSQSPIKSRGLHMDVTGAAYLDHTDISEPQWSYALPHWVEVSFWTGDASELSWENENIIAQGANDSSWSGFLPSCRMYELQMMGLMEIEMADITLPELGFDSLLLKKGKGAAPKTQSDRKTQPDRKEPQSRPKSRHSTETKAGLQNEDDIENDGDDEETAPVKMWMMKHDTTAFEQTTRIGLSSQPSRVRIDGAQIQTQSITTSPIEQQGSSDPKKDPASESRTSLEDRRSSLISDNRSISSSHVDAASVKFSSPKRARASRHFSLGIKGLGPGKATAVTSLSSANVATKESKPRAEISEGPKPPDQLAQQLRRTLKKRPSQLTLHSRTGSSTDSTDDDQFHSNPISIQKATAEKKDDDNADATVRAKPIFDSDLYSTTVKQGKTEPMNGRPPRSSKARLNSLSGKNLSPVLTMSPWLTMLNPSNPRKDNMTLASQYRRWHHVFPRVVPTSVIKWKSLICPAALPITSEYFPTYEDMYDHFSEYTHHVSNADPDVSTIQPLDVKGLLKQLIASRVANGFQIVGGVDAETYASLQGLKLLECLGTDLAPEDNHIVLMSSGSDYHQLQCVRDDAVLVRRYTRKSVEPVEQQVKPPVTIRYQPRIRTMLAETYDKRRFEFSKSTTRRDWAQIDQHSAGARGELAASFLYWRARFVLIPVEVPRNTKGTLPPVAEVSDEEIRLEGIQRLTQLWQRYRYMPAHEKRHQASVQQLNKDTNPLAIDYQTRDPSAIVRAHAAGPYDSFMIGEQYPALFAEADMYHSNDFDMQKLGQDLQAKPPKGLTVVDRRWHWKVYHKCFRGDELTTWLLANFKDMQSREDAVKLGNELMKRGLFTHVQSKHHFRDGNYFYQIASEHRQAGPSEVKPGWFSRMTDRSVPTTPSVESHKNSPLSDRPISRQSVDDSAAASISSDDHTSNREKVIELSRMLLYDVDPRGKSWRPEIIHLHYDRIHNPANCYHLRIDWMNVTSKLIEDAIVAWATSVERFGLKLVEVPIAEANAISDQHPFRAPYRIQLAVPPPKIMSRPFETNSSTTAPPEDNHAYQKALLRKWDFALDMESARSFNPSSMTVTYSWGPPDYKYTQFIHKSGTLLAQIDDDGAFLLLANRLSSNRAASSKDTTKLEAYERHLFDRERTRTVPPSARGSPYTSPLIRAADASVPPSPHLRAHLHDTRHPPGGTPVMRPQTHTPNTARPTPSLAERWLGSNATAPTAEEIKAAFERFCASPADLEEFYDEAQRLISASAGPSPRQAPVDQMRAVGSPRVTPLLRGVSGAFAREQRMVGYEDIPVLGLGERRVGGFGVTGQVQSGAARGSEVGAARQKRRTSSAGDDGVGDVPAL